MKTSPSIEDSVVIEGFLRGDAEAVLAVDRWIDVALRESAASLRGEWEDLKQEVRTRLLRNLSRRAFDGRSGLRTYVHRMAKNVCIDAGLRRQRTTRILGRPVDPSEIAADSALEDESISRDLLARMLRGIPPEDRRLLELVFVQQYSCAEVAQELEVAEGTVKSRISRCRARILARGRRFFRKGGGRP